MSAPTHHGPATLADKVRDLTGLNPAKCYQCGKCSAGCPMAEETDLRPHDVMRMVVRDQADRLLADESIWLCLTCETCTSRCPNGCDPARTMDALRELAVARDPKSAPRAIRAFHKSFLGQIEATGRMAEVGLIAKYKLRSGHLFADVDAAPGMMARGKLPLLPHKIDGIDDVRRIFQFCRDVAHDHGGNGEEDHG